MNYSLLSQQNASTSSSIITLYASDPSFLKLSQTEGNAILQRDAEDAQKLQVGIDLGKQRGVIDPEFVPEEYVVIDVLGKRPEDVCDDIIGVMEAEAGKGFREGDAFDKGSVVVICGLSGTGKGTTVAKLSEKLATTRPVVTWSNGNIFRSLTLLAATWHEQQKTTTTENTPFDPALALTDTNIKSFIEMLSFDKYNGKFDTRIHGLGLDLYVSDIQNTTLKQPNVSRNIPTVAEQTQGEVILFAASAISTMSQAGITTILEGREQTVNYVRTPMRFTLTLSDESLIGKRRAAQRLGAATLEKVDDGMGEESVKEFMDGELEKLVSEIES